MDRKLFFIVTAVGLCVMASGCTTVRPMSTLQKRAIESRDISCSYDNAYRATLTVLQDNGYSILTSDYQGGLIRGSTGESPAPYLDGEDGEGHSGPLGIFDILAGSNTRSAPADITVTVEKYTDTVAKMRITLDRRIYNEEGKFLGTNRVYNPDVIQRYYTAIQKEIFMREQLESKS